MRKSVKHDFTRLKPRSFCTIFRVLKGVPYKNTHFCTKTGVLGKTGVFPLFSIKMHKSVKHDFSGVKPRSFCTIFRVLKGTPYKKHFK